MSEVSERLRVEWAKGDQARDAGLTTPAYIRRYNDIPYGDDRDWNALDVYRNRYKAGKLPVIMLIHGGGWVYGCKELYQYYGMELARRGFAVVNYSYRLAPEHPFPAQLQDTVAVAGSLTYVVATGDAFTGPDTLERLAQLAQGDPGVIYGQTQLVDHSRRVVGMRHLTAPEHLTAASFKQGMLVCHQAFVARRDLVPHYDRQYRFSADYDWCIRVLEKSPANAYAGPDPIISFLTDGLTDKHHRASLMERYRIMCRHYGTLSTIVRHIGFVPRFLAAELRKRSRRG